MPVISGGGGAGGGSQPGVARVLGPFPFVYNTAGLANGHVVYTPTAGDVLLDGWIEIDTHWNGTTPTADLGQQDDTSGGFGWFAAGTQTISLLQQDAGLQGGGYKVDQLNPDLLANRGAAAGRLCGPGRFTTASPVQVWVTQDGMLGGTAPGASQGAAGVFLVIATPSLT